jgi:hypothetical protein
MRGGAQGSRFRHYQEIAALTIATVIQAAALRSSIIGPSVPYTQVRIADVGNAR